MIKSLRYLFLPFVIFSLAPSQCTAQDDKPFLILGEKHTLYSEVLGESRDIIVGLPEGYENNNESYPVVYLLDGPGHFLHTTASARYLAENERMPGVIIVAIANTDDRLRDLTPPTQVDSQGVYPRAGGADNFLEFISRELKPYIQEMYRTRSYAILIGHSFGGLFAIHTLVHHPEVFNAYIAISPSLWWDEQRLVVQADSAFDDAEAKIGELYMTMGNEGNAMLGGALKFAGALEEKAPDGLRWEFKHMEEETHGSVPLRSTLDGFEKIFSGWYLHDPVSLFEAGGLFAIDHFFERATERFGYERSTPLSILYQIGSKALENEDASEAKAIFTRIVEKDPRAASGHIGLAEAYDLAENTESAISHYQHALKNDPKNKKAREKLAAFGVDLSAYPENVAIPLDVLKTYVGRYINPGLDPHDIAMEGDELVLKAGGQDIALYAVAKDRFRSDAFGLSVSFEADETGSIMSMTVEASGWSRRFERN